MHRNNKKLWLVLQYLVELIRKASFKNPEDQMLAHPLKQVMGEEAPDAMIAYTGLLVECKDVQGTLDFTAFADVF